MAGTILGARDVSMDAIDRRRAYPSQRVEVQALNSDSGLQER